MGMLRWWTRATLTLGAVLLLPSVVQAQESIPLGSFSVLRFAPAPGPANYFMVEGAQTPGHIQGSVGLVLDYAHAPLVLYNARCDEMGANCDITSERTELVQYTAAGHITGSFTLLDRIQIGLVAPLVLSSGDGFTHLTPEDTLVDIPSGEVFTLADPRLSVKGRLYSHLESGFSIGASAFVTIPTAHYLPGSESRYVGDPLPTFGGQVIAELVNSGFRGAVNVGGMYRDETQVFSTTVGSNITYGAAAGYDITSWLGAFGEINGASSFSGQLDEHYLEWRAGARVRVEHYDITAAAGSGLTGGVGVPLFRAIAGFQWAPVHSDGDADGVEDSEDDCPAEAEDMDGWEDDDGCPELDNDDDGRADEDDPCPNEAEDVDGFEDEDGCPDTDNDGDGVHDGYDSCPNEPEDMDGDRDEDGCPDNDTDRDGIPDSEDQCPNEEEDFDGFGDEDGCPETDFDEDGLSDEEDQCPDQAEDIDSFEDEDGCPEEGGTPLPAAEPSES